MRVTELMAATLGKMVDGHAGNAIDDALRRVREDLVGRPALGAKRGVTIKLTFAPVMDQDGRISEVDVGVTVSVALPAAELVSRAIVERGSDGGGKVLFSERVPEHPQQGHLAEVLETEEQRTLRLGVAG
jgi:hypothetical protein